MDDVPNPRDFLGQSEMSWEAGEVVRELDDRPHLLLRIQILGASFPHLDAQPFVRLLGRRTLVESWFAMVAENKRSLSGYFGVDAPMVEGIIEYGYGSRVFGRIPAPFDPSKVKHLDRERLPADLVEVTEKYLRRKEAGRVQPDIRLPDPRRRRRT